MKNISIALIASSILFACGQNPSDGLPASGVNAKILFFGGKTTAKLSGFGGKYVNSRSKIDVIKEQNLHHNQDNKAPNIYQKITVLHLPRVFLGCWIVMRPAA